MYCENISPNGIKDNSVPIKYRRVLIMGDYSALNSLSLDIRINYIAVILKCIKLPLIKQTNFQEFVKFEKIMKTVLEIIQSLLKIEEF